MPVVVWLLLALLGVGFVTRRWWEPRLLARGWDLRACPWRWWLAGYPRVVLRIWWTWRRVCLLNGLSVSTAPNQRVIARNLVVQGRALRPRPPRMGLPRPTRTGLVMRVILHPGQTPAPYLIAARALEHAWKVYGVRVTSPRRGEVLITVTGEDPLTSGALATRRDPAPVLLSVVVGRIEDGGAWVVNLRKVPHWLITGATQSGKSTLLAAMISGLARQPVALVGIDCKGGMELGLLRPRFSALATDRKQAIILLDALIGEVRARMTACWSAGVRSVWELPDADRPVPIVLVVDELAELYLTDGSRESRDEAEQCGTLLLRLAQLSAALGVHLVIAGQRVGYEMGPRVTALRAQLGGRVAHRSHDEASAEMTLGDTSPDAVIVAQTISEDEKGVAVVTTGGQWIRARSTLVTTEEAKRVARVTADLTPQLSAFESVNLQKEGGEAV